MGTETEVKVRVPDIDAFVRRIENLRPRLLAERHFEDNIVLDFPDGRIRAGNGLVRVRCTDHGAWLTYKGVPRPDGIFKVREELESGLSDGPVVTRILERLGMATMFRYQKYRREYEVATPPGGGDVVRVALDETPIGLFAEFEGSEEGIRGLSAAMGFGERDFLRDSYYALYMQSCRDRGLEAAHMVFGAETAREGKI